MLRPLVRPLVRALTRSPMESRGLRPTLSLDFTNGGVTDSRVTYSGGANGTRVNSAGLIVAATTPRFDYNPVTLAPLGLLVEEARTNLILRSDNFDHAAWDKANSTSVGNAWGGVAGDSLKLLVPAAATSVVAGGIYTASFKFKDAGARYLQAIYDDTGTVNGVWTVFDLQTGTITQPATAFGTGASAHSTIELDRDGYYRMTLTGTAGDAAIFGRLLFSIQPSGTSFLSVTDTTGKFLAGYAQLELGSFATSYIPTTSAPVTRSADSAVMTGTNFSSWYNQAGGSAVVQFDLTAVSGTRPIISFDDNTANERIELYATGTDLRMKVTDGGATQVDMSIGTVAANITYKAAIAWAANDFAGCLNGGTVATDASGTLPAPDRLRIGSDQAGNFQCGHDKTLKAFAQRLPNATLQGMTA